MAEWIDPAPIVEGWVGPKEKTPDGFASKIGIMGNDALIPELARAMQAHYQPGSPPDPAPAPAAHEKGEEDV